MHIFLHIVGNSKLFKSTAEQLFNKAVDGCFLCDSTNAKHGNVSVSEV